METCDGCKYLYTGRDLNPLVDGNIYCMYNSRDYDIGTPQKPNRRCKHYKVSICSKECEFFIKKKDGLVWCSRTVRYCPKEPKPAPIVSCNGCEHAITYRASDDTVLCNVNESDADSLNKGNWWPNKGCSQHTNNRD